MLSACFQRAFKMPEYFIPNYQVTCGSFCQRLEFRTVHGPLYLLCRNQKILDKNMKMIMQPVQGPLKVRKYNHVFREIFIWENFKEQYVPPYIFLLKKIESFLLSESLDKSWLHWNSKWNRFAYVAQVWNIDLIKPGLTALK